METLYSSLNAVRVLFRRKALVWSSALAQLGQQSAEYQIKNWGDVSHDYVTQTIAGTGNRSWAVEKAACLWLKSEGHRAIVLSDEVLEVGCGVARDESGTLVVCNYRPPPTRRETDVPSICNHIIHLN